VTLGLLFVRHKKKFVARKKDTFYNTSLTPFASESTYQEIKMGTVLSFSPRERRPIYTSTTHHGSGTISTSNSTSDFQIQNNYAYEQMNNVKNRENTKPMHYLQVPNQFQMQNGSNVLFGSANPNIMNNAADERAADSARILLEKNAIEKNLKKHSLFINALSWKRLSSSHGKKKLESNGKSKSGSITTTTFRPPGLTDVVHPMVVVNEKKKYPQQIQLVSNNNNTKNIVNSQQQPLQNQTIFYTPGDPKNVLALDLERAANNANNLQLHHHHNVDKVERRLSIPIRPVQLTQQTSKIDPLQPQPIPRKTIIQVS
jgi:cyclin-dependent kinase 5 activator 1